MENQQKSEIQKTKVIEFEKNISDSVRSEERRVGKEC